MSEYYSNQDSPTRRYDHTDAPIAPVMRMVDWLIVLIISILPVANIIVLIIWALDTQGNPNRTNFAKALLLFVGAEILVMTIFFGYFAGMLYKMATLF